MIRLAASNTSRSSTTPTAMSAVVRSPERWIRSASKIHW